MAERISTPSKTKEIIEANRFAFKKNFGQNFLIDSNILDNIAACAGVTKEDCVLEIGPGIGSLTQVLAENARQVVAVETDNTLISILEQRGGIKLYDKNVVIKTTGGLYLKEQAANLAVLMSIASSVYDKSIPSDWAFLADVGLTGELKRVPSMESRIKELDRMGFKQVFISAGGMRELHLENIRVVEAKFLSQLLNHVFGKKGNG